VLGRGHSERTGAERLSERLAVAVDRPDLDPRAGAYGTLPVLRKLPWTLTGLPSLPRGAVNAVSVAASVGTVLVATRSMTPAARTCS
jgi:hypothetical protein